MRHVSYMIFVMASLTMESLWLSGRASEREISIPHGDSFFFLCPALVTRRNTSFFKRNVISNVNHCSLFYKYHRKQNQMTSPKKVKLNALN